MTKKARRVEPDSHDPGAASDAGTVPAPSLDPRALRIAVAPDRRLPGDDPVTVSPVPVPVRPLDSDLAETGQFGGIAHGSRGHPRRAPASATGMGAGEERAPEPAGHERSGTEPAADEPEAEAATDETLLIVDGHPRRVRLVRIDTEHAILEFDAARPDGSAAGRPSTPSPAGNTGMADGPTRVRVVLGPGDRRRADGVVVREVVVDGWRFELEIESERRAALRDRARRGHETAGHSGPLEIHAIIPGRIVAISVSPGEAVEAGQQLLVLEAMKMQNELRAPREGEIEQIAVAVGATVDVGDLLMVIS